MIVVAAIVLAGYAHVVAVDARTAIDPFGPSVIRRPGPVVVDTSPRVVPFLRLEPVNHRGPPRERAPLWD